MSEYIDFWNNMDDGSVITTAKIRAWMPSGLASDLDNVPRLTLMGWISSRNCERIYLCSTETSCRISGIKVCSGPAIGVNARA